jgi:hypothetical protein
MENQVCLETNDFHFQSGFICFFLYEVGVGYRILCLEFTFSCMMKLLSENTEFFENILDKWIREMFVFSSGQNKSFTVQ